jgi:hypothetical protein
MSFEMIEYQAVLVKLIGCCFSVTALGQNLVVSFSDVCHDVEVPGVDVSFS